MKIERYKDFLPDKFAKFFEMNFNSKIKNDKIIDFKNISDFKENNFDLNNINTPKIEEIELLKNQLKESLNDNQILKNKLNKIHNDKDCINLKAQEILLKQRKTGEKELLLILQEKQINQYKLNETKTFRMNSETKKVYE